MQNTAVAARPDPARLHGRHGRPGQSERGGLAVKAVLLDKPRAARFLRLVALSGHAPGPWASLAELEILPAGK